MLDLKLFLGIRCEPQLKQALKKANPYLRTLFTEKGTYLKQVTHNSVSYFGKFTSQAPSLEELERLNVHIISLLQKLAPEYPFSQTPPMLLTLFEDGK